MPGSGSSGQPSTVPLLCNGASLLVLVLLSIGLALIVTSSGLVHGTDFLHSFSTNVFFILWVALTSAALLCLCRHMLNRLPAWLGSLIGFLFVQAITLGYSILVVTGPVWLVELSVLAVSDPALFVARNLLISLVASLVIFRHWALVHRWQEQIEAESRARLQSLQTRIRPHFLFNALNTISSLIPTHPAQAEQATVDLSELLRTGLRDHPRHTLDEELELVRGYLRIESLRLGDRLQVKWELSDDLPLDHELPALLVQPLVENAVVHGISRLSDGGELAIRIDRPRRKRLRVVIENPMPGEKARSAPGNHMALDNIRQRLELAYEEGARLKTGSQDGVFIAELVIPV
jgi:two-component system, LytTR family, sensor histidine kinase AlgZ